MIDKLKDLLKTLKPKYDDDAADRLIYLSIFKIYYRFLIHLSIFLSIYRFFLNPFIDFQAQLHMDEYDFDCLCFNNRSKTICRKTDSMLGACSVQGLIEKLID